MKIENIIQNNMLYQALVQSVTDYVIVISRDFKIITANNLFKNAFGLLPGDSCFHAWKGKDRKCNNCLVEKSFKDGKIHKAEETVVMKNGKSVQMLVKATPVKNEEGLITYVLETATDITEKQQLQDKIYDTSNTLDATLTARFTELHKSEERYRTIFEHSRDAILLTNLSGKIMEINKAGLEILGYADKAPLMSKKSVTDFFINPADRSKFHNKIAMKGFVTDFEIQMKGSQDRIFDALMTSGIIAGTDSSNVGLVVIIRDIIKIKNAQHQIETQNIRLSILNAVSMTVNSSLNLNEVLEATIDKILEILESDSVRIYLLNEKKDTLILTAHKGFSNTFISRSYIKRRKIGDGILGQTVQTSETRVADNISRSKDPYVYSFIEEGLKSTIYIPLGSKGEAIGVMCVSSHSVLKFPSDYVEFLAAIGNQIGVAVENANLYEDIKKAYLDLRDAKEQIVRSEKLASLGKLAATIAHEINNPLAAVLTYVRLMMKLITKDRFNPGRLDDISRYLETMERETSRCGEIVKNLLDFSRQSKISISTHHIEDIIDKSVVLLAHDLEINNIALVKDFKPNLPPAKCDFKQTQQAFINLISNASEAMPNGGRFTISAKPLESNDFLEISFTDTGSGISADDLKNIFEPFFTTKEEGKGVGLGLSVVYGIISRHNGSIDVVSKPGKGTTFTVKLPTA